LEIIHEFFAVTKTSVYIVNDKKDENGIPTVEKIALREKSKIPVGGRLRNGNLVGIMKERIVLYYENCPGRGERLQRPEDANEWGGGTSPIIALFLNKEEAMNCSNSADLKAWDPRWEKQTKEILNSIGDNHPVFVLFRTFAAGLNKKSVKIRPPRVTWTPKKHSPMKTTYRH
jgi:hypothetical protein